MMVFWVVATLLIIVALLFLLPPLVFKGKDKDLLDRDALNATIFQDQIAELDRDLGAALLTQEQYDTARHDLERNFVHDSAVQNEPPVTATDRVVGRATAVVVAVLIPVVSVAIYNMLGSGEPGLNPEQAQAEMPVAPGQNGDAKQSLREAINSLQARLAEEPDNIENWVMLARSHYFLEEFAPASEAFARATSLLEDSDPDILADYADALAMANERNMLGRPYDLVQKALVLQPFHEKSLWLAGVAAFQADDQASTLKYWERLLQIFPEGSEEHQQMLSNVNEIRQNLGMVTTPMAAPVPNGVPASITGRVELSESLVSQVSPTDTVFVFARAVSGPRMPLAILRMQVKDLPATFTLDDSQAMSPELQLSNVDQVFVGARISKGGDALPQSGDLQGSLGPVDVRAGEEIQVLIDSVVP